MSRGGSRSRSPQKSRSPPRVGNRQSSPERSVYIAGIPFGATLSELEDVFSQYGPIHKIDMKKGYAFVFMKHNEDGDYVIRKLDGTRVLGSKVRVEWAKGSLDTKRREEQRKAGVMSNPSSTLFMVNFDEDRTREEDVRDFFRGYEIWTVSMKKNFAFVEFASVDQATQALKALNGERLFDRPIVLEYKARPTGSRGGPPPPPRRRSPTPPRRYRSPIPPPRRYRSPTPPRRYRTPTPPRRYRSPTPPPRGLSPRRIAPRSYEDNYADNFERGRRSSRSRSPPAKRYRRSRSRSRSYSSR